MKGASHMVRTTKPQTAQGPHAVASSPREGEAVVENRKTGARTIWGVEVVEHSIEPSA